MARANLEKLARSEHLAKFPLSTLRKWRDARLWELKTAMQNAERMHGTVSNRYVAYYANCYDRICAEIEMREEEIWVDEQFHREWAEWQLQQAMDHQWNAEMK